jgi:hypothetical protein
VNSGESLWVEKRMNWIDDLQLDSSHFRQPADEASIAAAERKLGINFPEEFREFLRFADGGSYKGFVIYSLGEGVHSAHQLVPLNELVQGETFPLIAIGLDPFDEDYGFRKSDSSREPCPIYAYRNEEMTTHFLGASFGDFMRRLASASIGADLYPKPEIPWWRKWWRAS